MQKSRAPKPGVMIGIDMEIISNLEEKDAAHLLSLFKQTWWAKDRSLQQTIDCIKGSQLTLGLFVHDELVGFARVVTDFVFKAIIFDVIVSEPERGKGLGKHLISAILEHPKLKNISHIELYCLSEMTQFYEEFGFSSDVGGIHLMRCSSNA